MKITELKDLTFKHDDTDLKGVEIKKHVPIEEQKAVIDSIINAVVYEDESGFKTYDSIELEIKQVVSFVLLFTNIDLEKNDYKNYNIIKECGLDKYFDRLDEYFDFRFLFDRRLEDALRYNSPQHLMFKRTKELTDTVAEIGNHINSMLDRGNPDKIAKYMSPVLEKLINKLPDLSSIDAMDLVEGAKNGKAN